MTGDQIRAMRQALGLSQAALAEAAGVSPAIIWLWERRGEADATPLKRSKKWDAVVLYLSTASPTSAVAPSRAAPAPRHDSTTLLWPWLPTAGPAYRARIHQAIHGRRA